VLLALCAPAWGQGMSDAQREDYQRLARGYVDTFRILGRAKACGRPIDRVEPFLREIERRHGEEVRVRLVPGPLTVDVDAVMRHAARTGATQLQPSAE